MSAACTVSAYTLPPHPTFGTFQGVVESIVAAGKYVQNNANPDAAMLNVISAACIVNNTPLDQDAEHVVLDCIFDSMYGHCYDIKPSFNVCGLSNAVLTGVVRRGASAGHLLWRAAGHGDESHIGLALELLRDEVCRAALTRADVYDALGRAFTLAEVDHYETAVAILGEMGLMDGRLYGVFGQMYAGEDGAAAAALSELLANGGSMVVVCGGGDAAAWVHYEDLFLNVAEAQECGEVVRVIESQARRASA